MYTTVIAQSQDDVMYAWAQFSRMIIPITVKFKNMNWVAYRQSCVLMGYLGWGIVLL